MADSSGNWLVFDLSGECDPDGDEFAEAERRAAMVAGQDDSIGRLAARIGRSLVEVGLRLHRCEQSDAKYRLGGVCLLSVEAEPGENPHGVVVAWTTHDLLLLDGTRWASYFVVHQTMNATLGTVLKVMGYYAQPFGTGGAWIVAADEDGAREGQSR